jgi:hypothetical protein
MVAGAAGAIVFSILATTTAPIWVPIVFGLGVGYLVSRLLTPYKEDLFANNPKYFGG